MPNQYSINKQYMYEEDIQVFWDVEYVEEEIW